MREGRFRGEMLGRVEADLPEGGTAVDVGCGTGTFALALKERRPDARVVAVDGDEEILALARTLRPLPHRVRRSRAAQGETEPRRASLAT